jgi:hypothetical protein
VWTQTQAMKFTYYYLLICSMEVQCHVKPCYKLCFLLFTIYIHLNCLREFICLTLTFL